MTIVEAHPSTPAQQDELYREAAAQYGTALERLATGYEANQTLRVDLVQEIHVALWRSFLTFDGRCSLRTWVYRVAHNVAATHVLRARKNSNFTSLDEGSSIPDTRDTEASVGEQQALRRLMTLVHSLAPTDRQVILLYLEGLDAAAIGEIAGFNPGNVATKIHRLKRLLAERFHEGGTP